MSKYTRKLQFNKKTKELIYKRENGQCFFCKQGYFLKNKDPLQYQIKDIMHYIPKSSSGLGVEENGVLGCRYHHSLLDNGNKGLRKEMLGKMKVYLKSIYPDWNEEKLVYQKYSF